MLNRELKYQSVVKFPRSFYSDCVGSFGDIFLSECFLKICIPSSFGIFVFNLSSYITFNHGNQEFDVSPVIYDIDDSSVNLQTSMHYYEDVDKNWSTPDNLLRQLNSTNTILATESIADVSLEDFLTHTKKSLKNYLTDTFTENFSLIYPDGEIVNTVLANNFTKNAYSRLSKKVNLISKIVSPKTLTLEPHILSPFTFETIKTISKELDSFRFVSTLENSLNSSNCQPKKIHKV